VYDCTIVYQEYRAREKRKKAKERGEKRKRIPPAGETPAADTDVFLVHNLRAVITRASRNNSLLPVSYRRRNVAVFEYRDRPRMTQTEREVDPLTRIARLDRLFVICCRAQLSSGNSKTGGGEEGRGGGERRRTPRGERPFGKRNRACIRTPREREDRSIDRRESSSIGRSVFRCRSGAGARNRA